MDDVLAVFFFLTARLWYPAFSSQLWGSLET